MKIYLDTNILISALIKNDISHQSVNSILNSKVPDFYTAPITLLEFGCRIGRLWREKKIRFPLDFEQSISVLSTNEQVKIIHEYCWKLFRIHIKSNSNFENYNFQNQTYIIEDTLTFGLKYFPSLPLKTLDLIQIASAMKIKLYSKIDLEYFLSNDQLILDYSNEIYQKTRILPIGSSKFCELLH